MEAALALHLHRAGRLLPGSPGGPRGRQRALPAPTPEQLPPFLPSRVGALQLSLALVWLPGPFPSWCQREGQRVGQREGQHAGQHGPACGSAWELLSHLAGERGLKVSGVRFLAQTTAFRR